MNAYDSSVPPAPAEPVRTVLERHCVPMPAGDEMVHLACVDSPLGPLVAGTTARALCFIEFAEPARLDMQLRALRRAHGHPLVEHETAVHAQLREELDAYFVRSTRAFRIPLDFPGTPFQRRVWDALRAIPHGETRTYDDVAKTIGAPRAVRAVGAANGRNRIAILVPCHRLVGSDGSLTGYGGGLWRKRWLLDHESGKPTGPAPNRNP